MTERYRYPDINTALARERGPVSLYAIQADWNPEVTFMICDEEQAADHAVFIAAKDLLDGCGSPTASVYRVGPVTKVREAKAIHVPDTWEWAREVHAKNAEWERETASLQAEFGKRES